MPNKNKVKINEELNLIEREVVLDTINHPKYEYERDQTQQCHLSPDKINNCSLHFHNQIEIIAIQTSKQQIQINNQKTVLNAGEIAISDCFDLHSYTYCDAISTVLIIPDSFLTEFKLYKKGLKLKTNFIRDHDVFDECFPLLKQIASTTNHLKQKGYINVLLGSLVQATGLASSNDKNETRQDITLIHDILNYIEENYAEELSLNSIAAYFSYSPSHFSRLFNSFFHYNLTDYINTVRLRKFFEKKEEHPDANLISLILESGFSSVPTFYRLFSKKFDSSPHKYFNNWNK